MDSLSRMVICSTLDLHMSCWLFWADHIGAHYSILRKNEYTWLAGSCGGVNGLGKKWVDTRNAVMEELIRFDNRLDVENLP